MIKIKMISLNWIPFHFIQFVVNLCRTRIDICMFPENFVYCLSSIFLLEKLRLYIKVTFFLLQEHNGTIIYAIRMFEKLCSLRPMWYQIGKINEQVREIMRGHPEGVHFVCYSQGTCYALCLVDSFNSIKFWIKQKRLTYLIFINKSMHMTTRYMYAYFHFRIEICRKNITQKLNTFTF